MTTTMKISTYPSADNAAMCFQGETVSVETLEEVAQIACKQAWSASYFKDDYRKNDNFMGAHLIALDIDDGCKLSEGLEKFRDYKHIIYTTRNHLKVKNAGTPSEKPAVDRFRVVLVLERPIMTEQEYKLTWKYLHKKFPFIDDKAKDPARFFFPGNYVSLNSEGQTVKVISGLSRRSRKFIDEGAEGGEWNDELYRTARDLYQHGYDEGQAIDILERPTKLPGNYGYLDEVDLNTIHQAFKTPPKFEPRIPVDVEFDLDKDGNIKVNFDSLAQEIIDPYYIQHVSLEMTSTYEISDFMTGEVAFCKNEDVLLRHATKEINQYPEGIRQQVNARKLINHWRHSGHAIEEEPKPFGWLNDEEWVVKRLKFVPGPGNTDAWDEFTSRLSDAEAFMAWVWSCFELKNRSRQAIWLYGPMGQDGKSTVLSTLSDCFGAAAGSITGTQIKNNTRFLMSSFHDKRIVVYPDAKNRRFPMTEVFRNMVSDDPVHVEFKGGESKTVNLYLKLAIASNDLPELNAENADLSRLVLITVNESQNKDDPTWKARLKEQLPHFLHKCREVYKKHCPNHGQIRVSKETINSLQESADDFQEWIEFLLEDNFEMGKHHHVKAKEFLYKLQELNLSTYEIADVKRYLKTVHKVEKRQVRLDDGSRPRVYVGLRLKQRRVPNNVIAKSFGSGSSL